MNAQSISDYAQYVIEQIDNDVAAGIVPSSVRSFSELHDHVDANAYLTVVPDLPDGTFDTDTINAVTDEVDRRLKTGE